MKKMLQLAFVCAASILLSHTLLLGIWSDPVDLFSTQDVDDPAIALDASGNAVAIAAVNDDLTEFYEKTVKIVQGAVQSTHNFVPVGINDCENVITVNDQGNGLASWIEIDTNTSNSFLMGTYLNGSVWETPTMITDVANYTVNSGEFPGINLDNANKGLVAWIALNTNTNAYHVQYNKYQNGWLGPQDIFISPDILTMLDLSGTTASGNAIAAWISLTPLTLTSSIYNGTSWTNTAISTDVNNISPSVSVSMNTSNNAILLWINQSTQGLNSISYAGGVYGPTQAVYNPSLNDDIQAFKIALDDQGNAIALWSSFDTDINMAKVTVNRYTNGAWGTPLLLDTNDNGFTSLNIDVDAAGNAYAVWQYQDNATTSVYYQQYTSSTHSWLGAPVLLSQPGVFTTQPFLSMNAAGQATVIWAAGFPGEEIVQAVFSIGINPPQNLTGKQVKNRFLTQTELVNVLYWTPALNTNAVKYNIYRNGELIGSTSKLTYQDHNRRKNVSYTYTVTAVNSFGIESSSMNITLP